MTKSDLLIAAEAPEDAPDRDERMKVRRSLTVRGATGAGILGFGAAFLGVGQPVAASVLFIIGYTALAAAFVAPAIVLLRMRSAASTGLILCLVIALGALATVGAGSIREVLQALAASSASYPYLFAPPVEEALKAVGVGAFAIRLRQFSNKALMLPLVVGALWAGYVFGVIETLGNPEYSSHFTLRLLSSVPGHSVWSFVMGTGITMGLAKTFQSRWVGVLIMGCSCGTAVLLHALWNSSLYPQDLLALPLGVWLVLALVTGFLLALQMKH